MLIHTTTIHGAHGAQLSRLTDLRRDSGTIKYLQKTDEASLNHLVAHGMRFHFVQNNQAGIGHVSLAPARWDTAGVGASDDGLLNVLPARYHRWIPGNRD